MKLKTFGLASFITALYEAVGKYIVYREALAHIKSDRILYLAMPSKVYKKFCKEPIVSGVFSRYDIKIILYKTGKNEEIEWVK